MKLVKVLLVAAATAAAALAFSAGPASAHSSGDDWDGNVGVLNGNSIEIPVHIPVNVCGNGLAILGIAGGSAVCIND